MRYGGRLRGGAVGRAGWTLADQALSSGTNFALAVVVARGVSAQAFGLFAIVYSAYLLSAGAVRALTSEPFMVRYSSGPTESLSRPIASATGASVGLGIVLGLIAGLAGIVIDGESRIPLLTLGVLLPGLVLQDTWRYVFFATGAPRSAAVNDAVWAAMQLPLVWVVAVTAPDEVGLLVAAWAIPANLCALLGCLQVRRWPSVGQAWQWLHDQRGLGPRYLGEYMLGNGGAQLTVWAVGAAGGLVAAGSLKAAQVVLGPTRILIQAAVAAAVPEGVRARARSPRGLSRLVVALGGGLAMLSGAWGAAFLLLPESAGTALFGETWSVAEPLLLPLTIGVTALGGTTAAIVGLRSLADARRSLRAQMMTGPINISAAIGGAFISGATGAAWGIALSSVISTLVFAGMFLRAFGRNGLHVDGVVEVG